MSEFVQTAAELTLALEGSAVGSIANNLTTTVEGYALDARQGYALDQKKLDIAKVANNLATKEEGWALDARQGAYLSETKVGYTDITDNLTTDSNSNPLSARQGKALEEKKLDKANVVNNLTTTAEGYALDARQGRAIREAMDNGMKTASAVLSASGWTGSAAPYTQVVSVAGVTADNVAIVSAAAGSFAGYSECGVHCTAQAAGKLTFAADSKPDSRLTANVVILTGGLLDGGE